MGTPFQQPNQQVGGNLGAPAPGSSDVTVLNPPGGTVNTIPKWTAATVLGDSTITDTGTIITLGALTLVLGVGDATATTQPIIVRGPARSGADAAASLLTIEGFNGTGTNGGGAVTAGAGQILFKTLVPTGSSSAPLAFAERLAIGGGSGATAGGVMIGTYAINTQGDPLNGVLIVAGSSGTGTVAVGNYNSAAGSGCGRLQQTGLTTLVVAANSSATTAVELQANNTTGATIDRIRAWGCIVGSASAGKLFSVGDGAAYTIAWGVNFDGKMVNGRAANETATATAAGVQAVPLTVRGYLSFVDSGGTTRKIPYFDV